MELFRFWTEQENAVIRENYGVKLPDEIAKMLVGRSKRSVCTQAGRLGLGKSYQHDFDRAFFANPGVLNSYWAGFIAADGCIDTNSGHRGVTISLSRGDIGHLEAFVRDCRYTGSVRLWVSKMGYKPGAEYCTLSIHGADEWVSDLWDNYGISPRKSKTLSPPRNLDIDNSLAYCAGFIDGDGSIQNPKSCWIQGSATINIAGRKEMMEWVKEQFDAIASVRYNHKASVVGKWKDKDFWYYTISGNRAVAVARRIRIMNLPLMARKWNKVPL